MGFKSKEQKRLWEREYRSRPEIKLKLRESEKRRNSQPKVKEYNRIRQKEYLNKNPEKRQNQRNCGKRRRDFIKKTVFNHYGNKCGCCGENNMFFLTIDHTNNDGAQHRRNIGTKGGDRVYRWLIQNNFPKEFGVLCMNCNWAKRYGKCPHKK